MTAEPIHITDEAFEKVVMQSSLPVIVDFWAPWCGPCRAMEPVIDDIAGQFSEKINIFKCNVDDNPISPSTYGVKAIPTLIFFKDGQIIEQITGMASRAKLEEIINKIAG